MDPASLASDVARSRYYAESVPYARPLDGTVGSVDPLTPDDLAGHAAATYAPAGGGLIVVGDVDGGEILTLAEEHLGSWTGTPSAGQPFEAAPAAAERRVLVVDRPGSVQSEIRVGSRRSGTLDPRLLRPLDRQHDAGRHVHEPPEPQPARAPRLHLRGPLTVQLPEPPGSLRDLHGGRYGRDRARRGARSSASWTGWPGRGPRTTRSPRRATSPPASSACSSRPRARSRRASLSSSSSASRTGTSTSTGIACDRVTTAEVAEAARRHLRPAEAQVVVVGDAERIAGPLEELGLGTLEVRRGQRGGGRRRVVKAGRKRRRRTPCPILARLGRHMDRTKHPNAAP